MNSPFGQCVCGIWGFKTVLNLEGLHGRAGLWPSLRCFILSLLTLLFRISTLMVLIVSPSFGRPLAPPLLNIVLRLGTSSGGVLLS